MAHALQVSFRRLAPSEELVAIAALRYKQMRWALSDAGECLVVLEKHDQAVRPLAQATVTIEEDGRRRAEATAKHSDARVALRIALEAVRAQLGLPMFAFDPAALVGTHGRSTARTSCALR
jgi:hypothetical protein